MQKTPPRCRFTSSDVERIRSEFDVETVWSCRSNGADALGFIPADGIFRIAAGSMIAPMQGLDDTLVETCREFSAPEGRDPATAFTLQVDTPMPDASVAARFACGFQCDETAWTAPDGSHPIMRKQSE